MSKNFFVIIAIIIVLASGYYVFYLKGNTSSVDLRRFEGQIVSIDGDKITLKGMFVSSSTIPLDLQGERSLVFLVDKTTQFKKTGIMLPTYESLRATGETTRSYKINDLPKSETAGSLEDIKLFLGHDGTVVQVDFPYSIHNKRNPKASLVFYQSLITASENI